MELQQSPQTACGILTVVDDEHTASRLASVGCRYLRLCQISRGHRRQADPDHELGPLPTDIRRNPATRSRKTRRDVFTLDTSSGCS
jgi:hypothetical protein